MTGRMEYWLVGRMPASQPDGDGLPWEVQGLYDSESKAIARCEGRDWFIMPLMLNERVPTETTPSARAYYPRRAMRANESCGAEKCLISDPCLACGRHFGHGRIVPT